MDDKKYKAAAHFAKTLAIAEVHSFTQTLALVPHHMRLMLCDRFEQIFIEEADRFEGREPRLVNVFREHAMKELNELREFLNSEPYKAANHIIENFGQTQSDT